MIAESIRGRHQDQ